MLHKLVTHEAHHQSILKIIGIMKEDPGEPLDLHLMSSTAGMSLYHFVRVFEELTSISPARFLAALRVEKAKRLLLETSLSVTSICYDVGYNSQGTFTRLFTDSVGLSPRSFRGLRDAMAGHTLDRLVADYLQRKRPSHSVPAVSGSVHAPHGFCGLIFLGLFSSHVPRRQPIDGTLLLHQGRFELEPKQSGQPCCLMAAGFPASSTFTSYLLPSPDEVLVASAALSSETWEGGTLRDHDLNLRPVEPFDPPILTALPLLLALEIAKN